MRRWGILEADALVAGVGAGDAHVAVRTDTSVCCRSTGEAPPRHALVMVYERHHLGVYLLGDGLRHEVAVL